MVKPTTDLTVLSLVVSHDWAIHQLDVKKAFLHGNLFETIYAAQPAGFEDPLRPDFVYHLNKSLYGIKQSPPRAWYSRFASYVVSLGFNNAKADASLFTYLHGGHIIYLLLYVDDIVLTASSTSLFWRTIAAL